MKTTVEIPDELFLNVKEMAVSEGLTLKEVLVHSLELELEFRNSTSSTSSAPSYPKKKEKRSLHITLPRISNATSFPPPPAVKQWAIDPLLGLKEDRAKRDEHLLP